MPRLTTLVRARLGRNVRVLREQRRWSMQRLAIEAEVGERTISRIENLRDGTTASFDTLILHSIARALETTLEE